MLLSSSSAVQITLLTDLRSPYTLSAFAASTLYYSCSLFPDGSVAFQHPRPRRLEAMQLSATGNEATAAS
jgi:hypothetical protein